MFVLRPATKKDLPEVYKLAKSATTGITTLPPDKKILTEKLIKTDKAFSKRAQKPSDELYFFVLEDCLNKCIAGCSAILASLGGHYPFYSYRLYFEQLESKQLNIQKTIPLLKLKKIYSGPSEICSLMLSSSYRKGGLGRLLSSGRFLFMANYPTRFKKRVIAEMRGFSDENIISPFWEYMGRPFYEIDFQQADILSSFQPDFIESLIPRHPIYLNLLPKKAMKYIAKPHPNTLPALKMLTKEGFDFDYEVDIFDAGPQISASVTSIQSVKNSKIKKAHVTKEPLDKADLFLIANVPQQAKNFRCTSAKAIRSEDNKKLYLEAETLKALKIKIGDSIRYTPLHKPKKDSLWKKAYSSMVNGQWVKEKL
ncbi:MAG: arginine N-succinyltransferase [Chlamydiales bacterium]|nr:arginine N-succinyltransferase [Chlamydiales bacterium]NCF71190.1 arginine N-succinyltransferase [Chlamydiales bacterium]